MSAAPRSRAASLLVLPGLAFLALVFVLPLVGLVWRSFDPAGRLSFAAPAFTLANYTALLADPAYGVILKNTFLVALAATAATLALAYPAAFFMSRLPGRWGARLLVLALVPFWTSIIVRLYAFTQILPQLGLLYTTAATVIGMVYYLLPYMLAILYASMVTIDDELLHAARTLGASMAQALRRVFVPLTLPAVFVGVAMVFVISLGFFLTPAILGGPADLTIATYIEQQVNIARWGTASAMGVVLLATTLAIFLAAQRLFPGAVAGTLASTGQKGVARAEPLQPSWPLLAGLLLTAAMFVFLLAPLLVVVLVSFTPTTFLRFPPSGFSLRWYADFFHDRDWLASFWLSLRVAGFTAVAATALGLLTALGFERGRVPLPSVLAALFLAPLIVPAVLIAAALFETANGLRLTGTVAAYVTAHTLLALPITVLIARNALRGTGTELELAARTLGASRRQAFTRVTARLIAPSLLVAALFAFVTSWDEPVVALFLSGTRTTLPVHIFNHMRTEVTPTVAAVSTLLMALVLLGTLAAATLSLARRRRRLAAVG